MQKILVTGGCGYIGSHTIIDLIQRGYQVVSVDSLINSDESAMQQIEEITGTAVQNYVVDLCDREATNAIFKDHLDISGIIHFAALKAVGESVEKPFLYFRNNLNSTINVAEAGHAIGIKCFVFSSSCTVYGSPATLPVDENTPMQPAESPYGRTKQMGEQILEDVFMNSDVRVIYLRYFNPAGAHPSATIGESPINVALNLVPIITETAIGLRDEVVVFGDDYDTRDGTCIRDYIHIMDLARAHTLAMDYAMQQKNVNKPEAFNLGIGQGVTVLEAIQAFERVSGEKLNYRIGPRRAGDIAAIYADYTKAGQILGWQPQHSIDEIMDTAWRWEQQRRK